MRKPTIFFFTSLLASSGLAGAQGGAEAEAKMHVFVSGLYHAQSFRVVDERSFDLFLEQARFTGRWTSDTGAAFGFGATRRLVSRLVVGAAFERARVGAEETFRASLPHPFFFNRFRTLEGEAGELSYSENAVHVLLGYARETGRVVIALTGGPSYFWTRTEMIEDFRFTESFPFDEVTGDGITEETYAADTPGFNVGAWLGVRLHEKLAVGADLRFSKGTASFTTAAGNTIDVDAGGARLGGGVRLIF